MNLQAFSAKNCEISQILTKFAHMKFLEGQILGIPRCVIACYVAGVVALWLIFVVFALGVGLELRVKYEMMRFAGDAALLMAPALLLPRRWRMAMLIPLALIAIFLMACQAYYAYWHTLLPLSLVFQSASWNGFVADSALSLFGPTQWGILLITIAYGIGIRTLGCGQSDSYRPFPRLGWFAAAIAFYCLTTAGTLWQAYRYYKTTGEGVSLSQLIDSHFTSPVIDRRNFFAYSPSRYFFVEISSINEGSKIQLKESDEAFVEEIINKGTLRTSPLVGNENKNLIFIIVESLNADIIGARYGNRSIMPILDSLLTDSSTFAALAMELQVDVGGSSDGQLIYNTGLLPAYGPCTAMTFGSIRQYPSLAKSLQRNVANEYIVEQRSVWNHDETSRAYGYSALYDEDSLYARGLYPDSIGCDRAVFDMALNSLPELPQPFFAEIVTLSMHMPYIDPGAPRREWIDSLADIAQLERDYLQVTNYFDEELGLFLAGLKAEGLYDSSVIVLASDHDQFYKTGSNNSDERHPIAFIVLNSGVGRRIEHKVYQMDVYPTVLDIMGYRGEGYRGMGQSLLADGYYMNDSILAERRRASDLIIRSDYFRKLQEARP